MTTRGNFLPVTDRKTNILHRQETSLNRKSRDFGTKNLNELRVEEIGLGVPSSAEKGVVLTIFMNSEAGKIAGALNGQLNKY